MVLMHAQAAGMPCITTNHSGNPEVLPASAGRFVVAEGDERALACAMAEMISLSGGDRRQIQEDGRRCISEQFDVRTTVAGYERVYQRLIDGRG